MQRQIWLLPIRADIEVTWPISANEDTK